MEFDSLEQNSLDWTFWTFFWGKLILGKIPENIHKISWTASLFYPPPALRISKMGYHTIPLEFHSHQTTHPPPPPPQLLVSIKMKEDFCLT